MKKQWKKVLVLMAVVICMVLSVAFSVSAKDGDINDSFSGAVISREYTDISSYRKAGAYTAPTAPSGYSNYVFTGWFKDADCTTPLGAGETAGLAYAKFVIKDVFGVKAQFKAGTKYDSEDSDIRFVTTVDSLDYNLVGFTCTLNGVTKKATMNEVYKKLYAEFVEEGDTEKKIVALEPSAFSESTSKYFMAAVMRDIPNMQFGDAMIVTPFWETLDGTTVEGEAVVKTVNNGYVEAADGVIALDTPVINYADYVKGLPALSEGLSYAVQGGCIGKVDGNLYYYQAVVSSDNMHSYILKIDMNTWTVEKCSGDLPLNHTNDITYNEDLGWLVVVHNAPYNEKISFVNPKTLTIVNPSETGIKFGDGVTDEGTYITTSHKETVTQWIFKTTKNVKNNLFSIEYNSYQKKYVVGITGGQTFRILNEDFSDPKASSKDGFSPTANTAGYTTQGVAADDSYIYFILYRGANAANNNNYPGHVIAVYDWNGNYVTVLNISGNITSEPENISIHENAMYISCQNRMIYKVENFDIQEVEFEARIGSDAYYKTLEEAVDAVKDGETITILSEKISVSKNLNITKLNVTITNEDGLNVVIKKGADFSGILLSNRAGGLKIQSTGEVKEVATEDGTEKVRDGSITFTGNGYSGSSLIYNYANADLSLDGVGFKNIDSNGSGAGVCVQGGTVSVKDCAFENNTASNQGGAFWAGANTEVTIEDSQFTGNSTLNKTGGAVFSTSQNIAISDTTFTQNESATTAGAINCGAGTMTITDCKFIENKANSGNGGAVQVADGGQLTIDGEGTFVNNNASGAGGALRVNNAKLTVSGQTFEGNSAGSTGGAVDIQGEVKYDDAYIFTDSKFYSNTAGTNGGAIYNAFKDLQISGCTFGGSTTTSEGAEEETGEGIGTVSLGNSSTRGGAVYVNTGTVSIDASEFSTNSATAQGGAIYIAADATVEMANESTLSDNSTKDGGGGAIYNGGMLNVTATKFEGNKSGTVAGAIACEKGIMTVTDCQFISNTSNSNGGAVQVANTSKAKFVVSKTGSGMFQGNTAGTLNDDGTVAEGKGGTGGAIHTNNSLLEVSGYTFDGNIAAGTGGAVNIGNGVNTGLEASDTKKDAETIKFSDSTFISNSATGNGGAICNAGRDLTITGCKFGEDADTGNSATGTGGAIHHASKELNISTTSFTGNHAVSNGGAIYNASSGTLKLNGTKQENEIFKENIADGSFGGGAIDIGTGTLEVTGYTFIGNLATAAGGGAIGTHSENITATITNSVFKGNHTVTNGGAIVNRSKYSDGVALTITDCTFGGTELSDSNYAAGNGGAIYTQTSAVMLSTTKDTRFENNFAGTVDDGGSKTMASTNLGGAIYIASGALNVNGYTFANNSAYDGGAICNQSTNTSTITNSVFERNSATGNGGAIANRSTYTDDISLNITESTFDENTSVLFGGAIYNTNANKVEIVDTAFKNNYTTGSGSATSGGAIYNNSTSTLTIKATGKYPDKAIFEKNRTPYYGGAIRMSGNKGTLNIIGYTFKSNVASGNYGGAIYIDNTATTNIEDSMFGGTNASDGNTAKQRGGAIFNIGSSKLNLKGKKDGQSVFANNSTVSGEKFGGAIYVSNGTISASDYTFDSNSATSGGAVYIEARVTNSKFDNATFTNNTATDGGALYYEAATSTTAVATITDSVFGGADAGNVASGNGGAIYNLTSGLAVTGTSFEANSATTGNGGAIYTASEVTAPAYGVTLEDSTFTSNKTVKNSGDIYGGAIYGTATRIKIVDTAFKSNKGRNGGAIGTMNTCVVDMIADDNAANAVFESNNATNIGGAIRANKGTFNMTGYTFTSNTATGNGGAIQSEGATLNVTNCKFVSNTSKGVQGGGAILVANSGTLNLVGEAGNDMSTFMENSAPLGGAVATGGSGTVHISDYTFIGNTATSAGNAVNYGYAITTAKASINGCIFKANPNQTVAGTSGFAYATTRANTFEFE